MGDAIRFYRQNGPYGCFSNFSAHRITLKGKIWPTSEHYFQAQKFAGTPIEEQVRATCSPTEAARMGRDRKLPLPRDWEQVKDDVMREALMAKFTQHEDLKQILIGTGTAELIEHTRNDRYWGDGGDGSGRNRLGHLLEETRERIRQA